MAMEWRIGEERVDYPKAVAEMEARVQDIRDGTAPELVWLLEHPPLYTAGASASTDELLDAGGLPVYATGRGGRFTYHGPGQRVAYVLLDLAARDRDIRCHVHRLEEWLIRTLAEFGVRSERRDGRIGIWVPRGGGREDKIAAVGVRVRRWVTYHGVALNVEPDLTRYNGIVPCGIREHGVTSLWDLGHTVSMAEVDAVLRRTFDEVFQATACAPG